MKLILLFLTVLLAVNFASSLRCYKCFGNDYRDCLQTEYCGSSDQNNCVNIVAGSDRYQKIYRSCVGDRTCRDLEHILRNEDSRRCSICNNELCNSASSITPKLLILVPIAFFLKSMLL